MTTLDAMDARLNLIDMCIYDIDKMLYGQDAITNELGREMLKRIQRRLSDEWGWIFDHITGYMVES